jgi:hypothetical protein
MGNWVASNCSFGKVIFFMGTEQEDLRGGEGPLYIAVARAYVAELERLLATERAARAAEAVGGSGVPSELALTRARERVEACRRLPGGDRLCQHVGLAAELQEVQEAVAVEVTSRPAWLQAQELLAAAELFAAESDPDHRAARHEFDSAMAAVEGLLSQGRGWFTRSRNRQSAARELLRTHQQLVSVGAAAADRAARRARLFPSEGAPVVREACERVRDLERPLRSAVMLRYAGTELLMGGPMVSLVLPSEGTVLELRSTDQLAFFHVHKLRSLDGTITLLDAHDLSAAGVMSGQRVRVERGKLVAAQNS